MTTLMRAVLPAPRGKPTPVPGNQGPVPPPSAQGPSPFQDALSRGMAPPPPTERVPWFGPSQPMAPVAPRDDVIGRAFDYPVGYNIGMRPRDVAGISFKELREFADTLDLLRLCIETRKDQMCALKGKIVPRIPGGQSTRPPADSRCEEIQAFLVSPDRRMTFDSWKRMLLEETLVIDAPAIYLRRTRGGQVYALEIIDGATIRPLLDETGRLPLPPNPAYQQILKGIVAANYSADELLYLPRNPRVSKIYGCSPVEQILVTVNIALRRELWKVSYYTEGNIPEALVGVPPDWSPAIIKQWQEMWDAIHADQTRRRRAVFVPGGTNYQPTRSNDTMGEEYDEWLARIITYAFSLPNTPFVRQNNRATAESAYAAALAEGLEPYMLWWSQLMNEILARGFGYPDLEHIWEDEDDLSTADKIAAHLPLIQSGILSVDEMRAKMGLQPIGMKNAIWGIGPGGIAFVSDIVAAQKQGLLSFQPPAPAAPPGAPPGAAPGAPGALPPGAAMAPGAPPPPDAEDISTESDVGLPSEPSALQGVPADLLAAVGLTADGKLTKPIVPVMQSDIQPPPLHGAASPHVLRTLLDVERQQRGRAR